MAERMTKEEFKRWLKGRTKTFAVDIFKFVDSLPNSTSTRVISFQLAKSASSMGANYCEASRAESGADFAHKISIIEKESDETLFWLEVLSDLYPQPHKINKSLTPLLSESDELLRLFTSIRQGCKRKRSLNSEITQSRNPLHSGNHAIHQSRNSSSLPHEALPRQHLVH